MACQLLSDDLDLIAGALYIFSLLPRPYSPNNDNYLSVNFNVSISDNMLYSDDIALVTFDDIGDLYSPPDELASKIAALKIALKFENTLLYLHNGSCVYCKLLKPAVRLIWEGYGLGIYEPLYIDSMVLNLRSGGYFCADNFPAFNAPKLEEYITTLQSVEYNRPWLITSVGTIRRWIISALLANTLHIYE